MKVMKAISVVMLTFIMTAAFAQNQGGQGQGGQRQQRSPEERAKTQVEAVAKDLALDQATQTKMIDILVKYSKKTTEERQKLAAENTDRAAITAKLAPINAERDKELKTLLGAQKFEQYTKKQEELRAAQRQRNN
jgi:hypothetical protein